MKEHDTSKLYTVIKLPVKYNRLSAWNNQPAAGYSKNCEPAACTLKMSSPHENGADAKLEKQTNGNSGVRLTRNCKKAIFMTDGNGTTLGCSSPGSTELTSGWGSGEGRHVCSEDAQRKQEEMADRKCGRRESSVGDFWAFLYIYTCIYKNSCCLYAKS